LPWQPWVEALGRQPGWSLAMVAELTLAQLAFHCRGLMKRETRRMSLEAAQAFLRR
jgi:hypothetical protein